MTGLPVFFVSHGAPDLVLSDHPARRALAELAEGLVRPRVILCISPHWSTAEPCLSSSARPETLHDFSGFPAPLYRLRYPAPGDPATARAVMEQLRRAGFAATTRDRGMDHGVWAPLMLAFPEAEVPVLSMSLPRYGEAADYLRLGQALAELRQAGVLMVASGTLTHNLGALAAPGTPPADWSRDFQEWLLQGLAAADIPRLMDWRRRAPHASRAHPTSEHLDPLWIALGAAGGAVPRVLYQGYTYGSLGMAHLRFD